MTKRTHKSRPLRSRTGSRSSLAAWTAGLLLLGFPACADEGSHAPDAEASPLRIAVASNFVATLEEIAEAFTRETGHALRISAGSSGKHYAQIRQGAPFDLFLAADVSTPARLEEEGFALPGSRSTYAVGRLVLWSRDPQAVDGEGAVLQRRQFRHLAIAHPELAPYGQAAQEVLRTMELWEPLQDRWVRGENVAQAFQFVSSGHAELGFVAWSQLQGRGESAGGSWWLVPESLHAPLEQQVVLLREGTVARRFLAFLAEEEARRILQRYGYGAPA